jgi:hypothetical protein
MRTQNANSTATAIIRNTLAFIIGGVGPIACGYLLAAIHRVIFSH